MCDDGVIADLDGIGPPGDHDDGGVVEVAAELFGVDGGGGDDDFEFGAFGEELFEVADEEVDIEAAFVGLVDDEGVVLLEVAIGLGFVQEDAVGHELDAGVFGEFIGEADLVADGLAEGGIQLLGDADGDGAGGDASGLGVADHASGAAAEFEADFRELGGFAGACFAAEDDELVFGDGLGDVGLALYDGQLDGEGGLREVESAMLAVLAGALDVGGELSEKLVGGEARAEELFDALEAGSQGMLIAQHALRELGKEGVESGAGCAAPVAGLFSVLSHRWAVRRGAL